MPATIVGSKAALRAFKEGEGAGVRKLNVTSNENKGQTVNIATGLVNFSYYESILQDVIRATVSFMDTGDSINGKTVMEGLPIYGSENATIKIEDNNSEVIEVELLINKPDDVLDDTRKTVTILNFASKEFFDNEKVRVNTRMDGLISQSVETILTRPKEKKGTTSSNFLGGPLPTPRGFLNSEKEVFIEKTANKRNFIGNNWKPFYTINWLAKQAVPVSEETGNSAGFMFWETADGFHFKSIDALMNQKVKKKFIYNETAEGPCSGNMPEGYDAKVLEMQVDNRVDVQKKLKMGAYSTRTWLFNPYDTSVDILYPNAFNTGVESVKETSKNSKGNQKYLDLAAKQLPLFNPDLNQNIDFSRSEFRVLDVGTLPGGKGAGENNAQIKESKQPNDKPQENLNQGNMRMNQLFASKVIITIPGDFSLHAGDAVFFDAPGLREDKKMIDDLDKHIGGYYIIGSICHYLDGSHTLTKMDLVRDSYGRKPLTRNNATSRTGSFQDRRHWRRSSSAAAKANTNKYGQNIKTAPNPSYERMRERRKHRGGGRSR